MMQTSTPDIRMAMDTKVNIGNIQRGWEHSSPTPSAYTICTAMCGNGFKTAGTGTIPRHPKWELHGWTSVTSELGSCVVVLGSTRPEIFDRRTATETYRSTEIQPWGFVWLAGLTDTHSRTARSRKCGPFRGRRNDPLFASPQDRRPATERAMLGIVKRMTGSADMR